MMNEEGEGWTPADAVPMDEQDEAAETAPVDEAAEAADTVSMDLESESAVLATVSQEGQRDEGEGEGKKEHDFIIVSDEKISLPSTSSASRSLLTWLGISQCDPGSDHSLRFVSRIPLLIKEYGPPIVPPEKYPLRPTRSMPDLSRLCIGSPKKPLVERKNSLPSRIPVLKRTPSSRSGMTKSAQESTPTLHRSFSSTLISSKTRESLLSTSSSTALSPASRLSTRPGTPRIQPSPVSSPRKRPASEMTSCKPERLSPPRPGSRQAQLTSTRLSERPMTPGPSTSQEAGKIWSSQTARATKKPSRARESKSKGKTSLKQEQLFPQPSTSKMSQAEGGAAIEEGPQRESLGDCKSLTNEDLKDYFRKFRPILGGIILHSEEDNPLPDHVFEIEYLKKFFTNDQLDYLELYVKMYYAEYDNTEGTRLYRLLMPHLLIFIYMEMHELSYDEALARILEF